MTGNVQDTCVICGSGDLTRRSGYADLLRVTSDSRIWKRGGAIAACNSCGMVQKPADATFLREADDIYTSYQMYREAGGHEQKIFTANGPRARSDVLLDRLLATRAFPKPCRMLDIGCGAGTLLKAAGKRTDWELYGNDISDHERETILAIPGVKGFLPGMIEQITGKFDVICMSHVLEHIPKPATFMAQLAQRLNPGGVVVILVPHWPDNPFDLLIADHRSHFTPAHMAMLMQRAGFAVLQQETTLLPKEIFALVKYDPQHAASPIPAKTTASMEDALNWLLATQRWAAEEKAKGGSYAVLGTSLAATWLTHAAELTPQWFVDEDPDRQGRTCHGVPVHAPADVPADMRVMIPLPPRIATPLAARLNGLHASASFLAPPTQEHAA